MPLYKFQQNDIFHNRIEAHPQCNFFIYSGSIYYNNRPSFHGAFTTTKARADLTVVNGDPSDPTPDITIVRGLDNDTITLIDAEGNEVTFIFQKHTTLANGSVGTAGNVQVGIKEVESLAQVMIQFRSAINGVTGFDQSTQEEGAEADVDAPSGQENLTLNITAARVSGTRILVLEQDTAGAVGNTTITIDSSGAGTKITGPAKFSGGNTADDQGGISAGGVPAGYVSLYGLNIDRVSGSSTEGQRNTGTAMPRLTSPDIIYPFIIKDGSYTDFKETRITTLDGRGVPTIDTLDPGAIVTGSYSLSASITKEYFAADHVHRSSIDLRDAFSTETLVPNTNNLGISVKSSMGSKISALQNTLDSYINLSHHYAYSSASLAVESNSLASWNKA